MQLQHSTLQALTTIKSNVEIQLAGKAINDRVCDWIESVDFDTSKRTISFACRFLNKLDHDAVEDWVRSQIAALRSAGVTGKISAHLCTHDQSTPTPCNQSNYREVVL